MIVQVKSHFYVSGQANNSFHDATVDLHFKWLRKLFAGIVFSSTERESNPLAGCKKGSCKNGSGLFYNNVSYTVLVVRSFL